MFGPYEIEYEGRRYFGNASLREFHIFNYDGNPYLIEVGSMAAHQISPRLAAMIARVASTSGGLIPESEMRELRKLKLIVSEGVTPSEAPPESKSGESRKNVEYPVTSIILLLAQECNMRCVYCYGVGGKFAGGGLMSEETAFRAVDWLIANSRNASKVNIGFCGGEPLLNFPLMRKVVSQAMTKAAEKCKQINFYIATNGSLLTDEIISFLVDEKIDLLISFDGPPEYQNRHRIFKDGRGSYDRVHANIQKLRAVFPNLRGRATVYGDADPFRIKEGMEQAGFTHCAVIKASPAILSARSTSSPSDDGFGEQELERLKAYNREQTDQLLAYIRERKINKDCPPRLLPAIAGIGSAEKRLYGCGIGKTLVAVSVTGDIYPCPSFVGQEELRMGNIADYNAGELNDYHRAAVDHLPECRNCWARYYCGGGCFYNNKARTGNMHRPDVQVCMEKKATFEGLIHAWCRLDDGDKKYLKDILNDVKHGPES
jgi:uncharacterized protein